MDKKSTNFMKLLFFSFFSLVVSFSFAQPNKQFSKLFSTESSSSFGSSMSISDTMLVVGACGTTATLKSVYVFSKTGNNFNEFNSITSSDNTAYDLFGASVGINDTNIIVGANRKNSDAGMAYLYQYYAGTWNEQILNPGGLQAHDKYGSAVAICDSFAVISAPYDQSSGKAGVVYLYNYNEIAKTWDFDTSIVAPDLEANENFGTSIAITNDYLYVGAMNYDGTGTDRGKVYIFKYSADSWNLSDFLAPDPVNTARFGNSIAVFDSTVIVGAYNETNSNGTSAGNAYIFKKTSSWNRLAKLQASVGDASDLFGTAVAIYGDTVVVSAPSFKDGAVTCGAAYVFIDSSGTWIERAMIKATDNDDLDAFGSSVAILGDDLFVGASGDDQKSTDAGAVYHFLPAPSLWQKPQNLLNQCSNSSGNISLTGFNIDSVQWQISQNNSSFSDLSDGIQYSGVNTNNLNITYEMSIDSAKYKSLIYSKYFQTQTDSVMLTFEKGLPVPDLIDLDTVFGQCSVSVTVRPTATDDCESSIIATTNSPLTFSEQGKDTIIWTYTDPNGNVSTQNQIVIVKDTISPTVTCPSDTIFVTANSQGEYIVSGNEFVPNFLDNCSGTTITNNYNNLSSLNEDTLGIDTLNILWTGTDEIGNSSECTTIIVVNEFHVGIDEYSFGVDIYPNPAKNFLYLKMNINDEVSVKIYSLQGERLYSGKLKKSGEINLQNFNQGLYYMELSTSGKKTYKKFVVEK